MISEISGCAPRPTINPKIPIPARRAVVSTPRVFNTKNKAIITAAYFNKLHVKSITALPLVNNLPKLERMNLAKKLTLKQKII